MLPGIKLFDMTGQTAIITGGSKGLGKRWHRLASAGARIAWQPQPVEAEEAASEITSIHGTEAIDQADATQTSKLNRWL